MKIGDKLKKMRGSKRIIDIAKETGLSFYQIEAFEENRRIPTPRIQKILVKYYGCNMNDLFTKGEVTGRAFVCGANGCKLVENFKPKNSV